MYTDFHNFFTSWLASKFAIKSILNIPPRLTNVATLPCETLLSENSDNLKHVCWWKKLKLVLFWRSYRQNGLIASHALFEVHCPGERCRFCQITCTLWTTAVIHCCYFKKTVILTQNYSVLKQWITAVVHQTQVIWQNLHLSPGQCTSNRACEAIKPFCL